MQVKRALLSVSDKTGLVDFAKGLVDMGVEMISTGGTYNALKEAGLPVTYISEVTGFPEILDGRVKTLHPAIHGGLLAIRDMPEHMRQLDEQAIQPIDMVVCNLYPFAATVSKPGVALEDAIENIDIGGPSMVRSAAKNHRFVAIVVNPHHYGGILAELKDSGNLTMETRQRLAVEAYEHTAAYDSLISGWLRRNMLSQPTPGESYTATFGLHQSLRYGENPHQKAGFYVEPLAPAGCVASAKQLGGKELSYCNIMDTDAALQIVREFADTPCVVAVKHSNPCGVGIGADIGEAWKRAYDADPVSIFGGIVALNRPVDAQTAAQMSKLYLEIIIAPGYDDEAVDILAKKKNLRVLVLPEEGFKPVQAFTDIRRVVGGVLVQESDSRDFGPDELKVVTQRQPTAEEMEAMLFGWKVVKHVKSNAIVVTNSTNTIGVGAGQMNRVGSAKICFEQGGELCIGAALASDALIPMADTVEAASKAGITAIIQTGGSLRDAEVIAAADALGMAMAFTGFRHFKH